MKIIMQNRFDTKQFDTKRCKKSLCATRVWNVDVTRTQ